jgi:tryptophan synthase alpha chain
MNRIDRTFRRLKNEGKRAFIPYIMAGDPDLASTRERIVCLEQCGADIVELGVPFSDPVADGPTIQRAAERALKAGTTLRRILPLVREVRQTSQIPIILMSYYNPIYHYGETVFVDDAVKAGVDGLIIPDLPPDEASDLIKTCRTAGLNTIFLVAPTSTADRIKRIVRACRGFVYYVSMTGITGSRLALEDSFGTHIGMVKSLSKTPVAVGFGVSSADEARAISGLADGVIVGSAIVKRFYEEPGSAEQFLRELRAAI